MQKLRPLPVLLPITPPTEVAYTEFKPDLRDSRIDTPVVEDRKIEARMRRTTSRGPS